ncbi:hypothetical protein TWF481_009828 [Arthrobotrys musiformis]|uniref:F-box domain-containing protein n=1 Tax=Arthrobotrys musiformis TaxID=47236 RepID=A0AAV9W6R7_9PEZI
MAALADVPLEILDKIMSNLPFFDILSCQEVCTLWQSLFFYNTRKWHYDSVVDATKSPAEGLHRLLKLYSGPGDDLNRAYQLVAFAKGRLLHRYHVYAMDAGIQCKADLGLGCAACQRQQMDGNISGNTILLSDPVVITDSSLLAELLFCRKPTGSNETPQVERTNEEQLFYDWMQSYHISLTNGSGRLTSYSPACDPNGNPKFDTAFIVAQFDLSDSKYADMTVQEFIEDAWDDFKSMLWMKHQETFSSETFSTVTLVLRESETCGAILCWLLCWHGRPFAEDPGTLEDIKDAKPDVLLYLQASEYILKLFNTTPL